MTRQQVIQWVRDNLPHWPTQHPPDTSPPGWSWLSTLHYGYVLINTDETDMVREDEVGMKIAELLKQADRCLSKIDDLITVNERKVILRIVNDYQRLTDEVVALREALRLKEDEVSMKISELLKQELTEINEKIQKLSDFMDDDVFLHLDPQDRNLILIQSNAMRNYQLALKHRLMRERSKHTPPSAGLKGVRSDDNL